MFSPILEHSGFKRFPLVKKGNFSKCSAGENDFLKGLFVLKVRDGGGKFTLLV